MIHRSKMVKPSRASFHLRSFITDMGAEAMDQLVECYDIENASRLLRLLRCYILIR